MWAMLRTGFRYDGYSHPNGIYVSATLPLDFAEMLKDWPGLKVTADREHERFGVCSIAVEAAPVEREKAPRPPLDANWRAPWNAVQLFVLQRLGMEGWEPYACGPNTSAGWPIHLPRKPLRDDLPLTVG